MTIWSTAALRFLEFVGVRSETQGWRWNVFTSSKGQGMSDNAHTIKITCVILRLQLGNKLRLLSQQTVPVQGAEEAMLLHFIGTTWKGSGARQTWEAAPPSQQKEAPSLTKHVKYLWAEKERSHGIHTPTPFYNQNLKKNSSNLSAGNLILLIAVATAQLFSVSFSMTSSIFHRLMTWPLKITLYWTWGHGCMLAQSRMAHYKPRKS